MKKRSMISVGCALVAALVMTTSSLNAQAVDNEAKKAAVQLLVTMRAKEQMTMMLPILFDALKPAVIQGRAELERDYEALRQPMIDGFTSRADGFLEAMSLLYARHFTAAELRELEAFMRQPTGQKFLAKTPIVTKESAQIGQRFGEGVAADLRNKMIDELRKRGHKI